MQLSDLFGKHNSSFNKPRMILGTQVLATVYILLPGCILTSGSDLIGVEGKRLARMMQGSRRNPQVTSE